MTSFRTCLSLYVVLGGFVFAAVSVRTAWCVDQEAEASWKEQQAGQYYAEGRRLAESGQIDSALNAFQKTIALAPGMASAYNEAAIIYTINGQPEKAKAMYFKAITISPEYPQPYANLALLYEEEGDFPNALACWKRRAALGTMDDPWNAVARARVIDLSQEYPGVYQKVQQGRYPIDIEQVAAADALPPADAYGAFGTYGASGAGGAVSFVPPEKVSLFDDEKFATDRGGDPPTALGYLELAKNHYANGEYVRALKVATVAEYLDPANPEISAFVQKIREAILQ